MYSVLDFCDRFIQFKSIFSSFQDFQNTAFMVREQVSTVSSVASIILFYAVYKEYEKTWHLYLDSNL